MTKDISRTRKIHPDFQGLSPDVAVIAAIGDGLMDPESTAQLLRVTLGSGMGPHAAPEEVLDALKELSPRGPSHGWD